jgi:serine/threonine-protein kinase
MNMQDLSGQTLGQYQLQALLGSGGMGTVYRAYQPNLRRTVAVKVLARNTDAKSNYLERFTREAQTAAALEHAHIIPVYDYGTENDINYIVMRYLPGGSFADRLEKANEEGRFLPLPEITAILTQVAGALDYAHRRGVIHRDIKPGNLMFDTTESLLSSGGSVFLVDFGIVKLLDGAQLTGTMATIGTPAYMPPEQWRGEMVTSASDQYSLGCVVYNALTGRAPFEAPTPYALMIKHVSETLVPPHVIRNDLPPALSAVVGRALAKNPDERYPSVGAFASAFEAAVRGYDPDSAVQQMALGQGNTGGSGPTERVAPLAGGTAATDLVSKKMDQAAQTAPPPPAVPPPVTGNGAAAGQPRRSLGLPIAIGLIIVIALIGLAVIATQPGKPASVAALPSNTATVTTGPVTATSGAAAPVTAPVLPTTIPSTATMPPVSATVRPPSVTATATPTATRTATATSTQTATKTSTHTPTPTLTQSATRTQTATPTRTRVPTDSPTAVNVTLSASGLQIQDLTVGTGEEAVNGKNLTVKYIGTLADGTKFDSSYDRKPPNDLFTFTLGNGTIIKGWDEGLLGMREGGKRRLIIPPELGYGALGQGPIPPNATLTFEIELIKVEPRSAPLVSNDKSTRPIVFSTTRDAQNRLFSVGVNAAVTGPETAQQQQLTSDTFIEPGPAYSPDGTEIAYISRQSGVAGLYRARADGTDVQLIRVTDPGAPWQNVRWAPNNILYVQQYDQVLKVDLQSGDVTPLQNLSVCSFDVSRDGQSLVFCGMVAGKVGIYLLNLQTGTTTLIVSADNGEDWPAFAPDGQRIVFRSNSNNGPLNIVNIDGTGRTALPDTESYYPTSAWSPDGKWIAFVATDSNGWPQVVVIGPDGQGRHQVSAITGDQFRQAGTLAWSRDSQSIVFTVLDRTAAIYSMNPDGTQPTRLTVDARYYESPALSPDGRQIALYAEGDIAIMNSDGSGLRPLNTSGGIQPAWSPDGKRLVYSGLSGDGNYRPLTVINTDGTGQLLVGGTETNTFDQWPSWSPDGKQIVFYSMRQEHSQIFVVNADGTNLRSLTPPSGSDEWPCWSPDGKQIAFMNRDYNAATGLWLMNADGSNRRVLLARPFPITHISWSADGKTIYYTTAAFGNDDIYAVTLVASGEPPVTRLTDSPASDVVGH